MKNWSVDFETRTRDDIMTICELLAEALKPQVNNGVSVLIRGGEEGGKSALVDGLTAACMDEGPTSLPKSLVEDEPDDALSGVRKIFAINSRPATVTFDRNHSKWRQHSQEAEAGIHFLTQTCFSKASAARQISEDEPDILIDFNKDFSPQVLKRLMEGELEPSDLSWLRKWSVKINSPDLQTPKMENALRTLKTFYGGNPADMGFEPEPEFTVL